MTTTSSSQSGRSTSTRNYSLIFYMKDGQGIPIHIDTPIILGINTGDIFFGRDKIINLGNKVASFIGVPFKNIRPPTAVETLSTIIDTVKDSINQHQPPPETLKPSSIQ